MNHNKNTLSLERETATPPPTEETWHKVGNSALAHFGESPQNHEAPSTDFSHLFPATQIPAELLLTEATTPEGAERLIKKLDPESPYKDYALSELALHHLKHHDLPHAYELMHQLKSSALAVHVLSEVVYYTEDHPSEAIKPPEILGAELRTRAIHSYFNDPSAENAIALGEAAEALTGDTEVRDYARQAREQHPELQIDIEDDNDPEPPKPQLLKRLLGRLVRRLY